MAIMLIRPGGFLLDTGTIPFHPQMQLNKGDIDRLSTHTTNMAFVTYAHVRHNWNFGYVNLQTVRLCPG